jgi:hypothetical protein
MVGKVTIVVIGLTALVFMFNSLKHASDPATNALRMVAGNGENTTTVQGRATLPGHDEDLRRAAMNDVICRWSGSDVVVTAHITNITSQPITISWEPEFRLEMGGSSPDPSFVQTRKLAPHQAIALLSKQKPFAVPAGTGITTCDPTLFTTPP